MSLNAIDERRLLNPASERDSHAMVKALADHAENYPLTWPDLLAALVWTQDDVTRLWIMGHVVINRGSLLVEFVVPDKVRN